LAALKSNLEESDNLESFNDILQIYDYQNGITRMPITYRKEELDEVAKKIFAYKYGEAYEKK